MIGDHHEWGCLGQVFAANYFNVFADLQNDPDPPPPKIAGDEADQSTFALDRFHPLGLAESEVMGGFVFPILHNRFLPGDDARRLFEPYALDIADVMKDSRRRE